MKAETLRDISESLIGYGGGEVINMRTDRGTDGEPVFVIVIDAAGYVRRQIVVRGDVVEWSVVPASVPSEQAEVTP